MNTTHFDLRCTTALIFDVDGTLYDSACVRRQMLIRLVRAHLARPVLGFRTARLLVAYRRAQEALRGVSHWDRPADRQLEIACAETGIDPGVAGAFVRRWMEQEPLEFLGKYARAGLHGLLETAQARGTSLGVVSDYPAEAKLAALGIASFFDSVVSAQSAGVGVFKPSACGLHAVLARLGAVPDGTVYIGDRSEVDLPAARSAGVFCVLVGLSDAGSGPGWLGVRDFRELKHVLYGQ